MKKATIKLQGKPELPPAEKEENKKSRKEWPLDRIVQRENGWEAIIASPLTPSKRAKLERCMKTMSAELRLAIKAALKDLGV
jgi:hypothetical protein